MTEKKEAVKYLSALSDEELREVLFEVFQTKRPNPEEDKFNRNCFFLSTASIFNEATSDEPERWGQPEIKVSAASDGVC